MAREFSKKFYKSETWKKCREYIYNKYHGICNECNGIGEEVHHIQWLTPSNIDDPYITLGEDNLVLLCRNCHIKKHRSKQSTKEGYTFNELGELVPVDK